MFWLYYKIELFQYKTIYLRGYKIKKINRIIGILINNLLIAIHKNLREIF